MSRIRIRADAQLWGQGAKASGGPDYFERRNLGDGCGEFNWLMQSFKHNDQRAVIQ